MKQKKLHGTVANAPTTRGAFYASWPHKAPNTYAAGDGPGDGPGDGAGDGSADGEGDGAGEPVGPGDDVGEPVGDGVAICS